MAKRGGRQHFAAGRAFARQNQTEHVQNVKEEDQEHKIYVFRVVHSNVPLWIRGSHIFANTTSSVLLRTIRTAELRRTRRVLVES